LKPTIADCTQFAEIMRLSRPLDRESVGAAAPTFTGLLRRHPGL
jgi:hypothetical protein